MTLPPPPRPPSRRTPRVRHGHQPETWAKMQEFTQSALRAGAGDDVGALTSQPKKRRFVLDGHSLQLVVLFLLVLALAGAIGAFSHRSVAVSELPAKESVTGIDDEPHVEAPTSAEPTEIIVHVSGEVTSPGIVSLVAPARVNDALIAAGGPTDEAELAAINLAQLIDDGAHIHVPGPDGANVSQSGGVVDSAGTDSGTDTQAIDINTADQARLETLPGIGPVTAQAIISWREENGAFSSVDQLVEVNGIGSKTLERLREHIRVS